MVVAGTGHRPDKLGGWDNEPSFRKTVEVAKFAIDDVGAVGVVSGMAAGWDLALAQACMETGVHLMCAIPFDGQERRWSRFWQRIYNETREYATSENVLFTPDLNSKHEVANALLNRNHWMVNYIKGKGGKIIALWNGTKGGTAACVRSAERAKVEVVNYWRKYEDFCKQG